MNLSSEEILATIFRLGMGLVYIIISLYFYRRYKQSKEAGFKNSFFLGFIIIFTILTIFSFAYGLYEMFWWNLESTEGIFDWKQRFVWAKDLGETDLPAAVIDWSNQYRPLYLSFYFIMNLVMASLVFPLEQAVGLKKTPFTKFIVACGIVIFLDFFKPIALSYFGIVIGIIGFLGIAVGLLLNIGVNIKLYRDSIGAIRKRSLYAIFAFLLLGVGLLISLETGFTQVFIEDASYRWDTIIGCCLQFIAIIFYRLGFGQEGLSE